MKRISTVLLALAVTSVPVQGQSLEFSGGANFSTLSSDAIVGAARNAGMNLGMKLVVPVGPVGIDIGGAWSQKGVSTSATSLSLIDLSYIEVPVHVRFGLVGAGPVRLNLILGPTVGINTGCKLSIDASALENCSTATEGAFEPEKLEWAGVGGLGVSFSLLGPAYAGVDLKYQMGLNNVSPGSSLDAKNRTFTLTTHLGFKLF